MILENKHIRWLLKTTLTCLGIVCSSVLLIIVSYLIACYKTYHSYKITGIHMQRVIIDNDSSLRNRKVYLISTDTKKEKDRYIRLMHCCATQYEPCPKSSDTICDASILTEQGLHINNHFTTLSSIHSLRNSSETLQVESDADWIISSFIKWRKVQPRNKILLILTDTTQVPSVIQIQLQDRTIKSIVNNLPVHYESY